MKHENVPAEFVGQVSGGWRDYYWNRLAAYLRKAKIAPVRRFMDEFKNHENIDIVDETWTADCVLHVPGFTEQVSRQSQKSIGKAIFEAFGEVHVEIVDTIVEGDRVVERHKATAISKGAFMGRAPTGKPVTWTENHIYRLRDGLIAETWSEVSFHDLVLNQLGPATVETLRTEGR
jgi:predicted ester cyclase